MATDLVIRAYQDDDKSAVIELWNACGLVVPWNDPKDDIDRKVRAQLELFLVGLLDGRVVASVMAGYEGHRGWINYLGVRPELQGKGLGRQMMNAAEERLRKLGCPKINLQVRTSNKAVLAFYERLGFSRDDVVSLGKRLT